jgi:phage shock protein A
MAHDKIKGAARKRMAETGEPYTAARRAAVTEHQATGPRTPAWGTGYVLRMSDEIHDWLADLRGSDPPTAARVVNALATLMLEGASTGDPLVVSTADTWPWALMAALEWTYQERLDRLATLRRAQAAAATLAKDIQNQVSELESVQAELEQLRRGALEAGRSQDAAKVANDLTALQRQAAEAERLLPGVVQARDRLATATQRLQAGIDALRVRKEVLKASYVAAEGSVKVREVIAASGMAGDNGDRQQEASGEAIGAAQARLADLTAQMERELGQHAWPQGLMALRPGAPTNTDIRILFAAEPPASALLIAVVEGPEAVEELYQEAVLAAADMLDRVRAGQAPEAAAHTYDDAPSFLEQFHPGNAGSAPGP